MTACMACGSSPSGPSSPFTATWTFVGGNQDLTCNGMSLSSTPSGKLVVGAGPTLDTLEVIEDDCLLTLTVSGDIAALASTVNCKFEEPSGPTLGTVTEYKLTLDGRTLTEMSTGTVTTSNDGEPVVCTVTVNATLTQ